MTTSTEHPSPLNTIANQYVQMARQSYAVLCYAANALDASRADYQTVSHFEHLADLIHALIERLAWIDGELTTGESSLFSALLEEDALHGGYLEQRIGRQPANPLVLKEVPEFIRACRRYDAGNRTRLEPMAVNALDALGMGLLAADREISDLEFKTLKDALSPCYRYLENRRSDLTMH